MPLMDQAAMDVLCSLREEQNAQNGAERRVRCAGAGKSSTGAQSDNAQAAGTRDDVDVGTVGRSGKGAAASALTSEQVAVLESLDDNALLQEMVRRRCGSRRSSRDGHAACEHSGSLMDAVVRLADGKIGAGRSSTWLVERRARPRCGEPTAAQWRRTVHAAMQRSRRRWSSSTTTVSRAHAASDHLSCSLVETSSTPANVLYISTPPLMHRLDHGACSAVLPVCDAHAVFFFLAHTHWAARTITAASRVRVNRALASSSIPVAQSLRNVSTGGRG